MIVDVLGVIVSLVVYHRMRFLIFLFVCYLKTVWFILRGYCEKNKNKIEESFVFRVKKEEEEIVFYVSLFIFGREYSSLLIEEESKMMS